jgi:hypothetical protein
MPNRGKHGKARAAAAEAREDIMSSAALSAMSAGAVNAMAAVGAAVIKLHKGTVDKKPEWFWQVRGQGSTHRRAGRAHTALQWRCHIHRGLRQDLAGAGEEGTKRARARAELS